MGLKRRFPNSHEPPKRWSNSTIQRESKLCLLHLPILLSHARARTANAPTFLLLHVSSSCATRYGKGRLLQDGNKAKEGARACKGALDTGQSLNVTQSSRESSAEHRERRPGRGQLWLFNGVFLWGARTAAPAPASP